ncbi:hypothetical protein DPMN_012435 [Dreissena polymorpha]|uniref:Uncharacterized protein n=1 Tax=Dreissena polymorpha TaxID=45954 RepID=A0A9D4N804_DREPO|nr:hypothetical protein DPMN_012435 [Dreissena polymorpha]
MGDTYLALVRHGGRELFHQRLKLRHGRLTRRNIRLKTSPLAAQKVRPLKLNTSPMVKALIPTQKALTPLKHFTG